MQFARAPFRSPVGLQRSGCWEMATLGGTPLGDVPADTLSAAAVSEGVFGVCWVLGIKIWAIVSMYVYIPIVIIMIIIIMCTYIYIYIPATSQTSQIFAVSGKTAFPKQRRFWDLRALLGISCYSNNISHFITFRFIRSILSCPLQVALLGAVACSCWSHMISSFLLMTEQNSWKYHGHMA